MTDIYFDNNATTRQLDEVTEVMNITARDFYGNPSSLHSLGYKAEQELRRNRQILAKTIYADEKEIYFTSGGSESNNWALIGYLKANPRKGDHILVSGTEHPSVLECVNYLKKIGYNADLVPVDKRGICDLDYIYQKVNENTALVSVMHVNSETGAIMPIDKISEIIKRRNRNTVFHTDCVQSFCKLNVDVRRTGIDLMSVSGHKIGGPRGIGFLYINKGIKMETLIYGGGQENGMRSGTQNLPAIAGFARAAEIRYDKINDNLRKAAEIRDYIINNLDDRAVIITDHAVSSPYVLNISFPSFRGEVILHSLEARGIYVSVGSACSSNKKSRSHVLKAMGHSNEVIDGAVRLSFSPDNTIEEAKVFIEVIREEISKLNKTR